MREEKPAVGPWQSMETAPKNGLFVLLASGEPYENVQVASYYDGNWHCVCLDGHGVPGRPLAWAEIDFNALRRIHDQEWGADEIM